MARLAKAARRLVLQLDAEAAAKRAARAGHDRRLQVALGADGTAALIADLPAEDTAACWAALDHYARARRDDGDERSTSQLMTDTLVERVTGMALPVTPLPPSGQLGVLVKASTLTGEDDDPAELAGHGPIPAPVVRRIAKARTSTLRRVLVDRVGWVVGIDRRTRRGFDPADTAWLTPPVNPTHPGVHCLGHRRPLLHRRLRRFVVLRDGWCRMPTCDSAIRNAGHIRPNGRGGRTRASNG